MSEDFYKILEVDKTASQEEIEKSYKRLARANHPDRNIGNPEAEAKFKEIQNAYDTLGNAEKRQKYDMYGSEKIPIINNHDGWNNVFNENIFDQFFNFKRQPDNDGRHIETEVTIGFMEAINGCQKTIDFDRREACASCKGTGAKDGNGMKECVVCEGRGKVQQRFSNVGGFMRVESMCSSCRGTGKVISEFCPDCHMRGFIMRNSSVTVDIPACVDDGMKLCLRGQGDKGLRGGIGNLYCTIRILPHALFKRNGNDILLTVPITYSQAVLGGQIEIPYPHGKCEFIIPKGTPSGMVFRLEGLGLTNLHNHNKKGDLLVKIEIDIPKNLPDDYNDLINTLCQYEKSHEGLNIISFKKKVDELK